MCAPGTESLRKVWFPCLARSAERRLGCCSCLEGRVLREGTSRWRGCRKTDVFAGCRQGETSPNKQRTPGWSDVRFSRARNDPSTARVAGSLFLLLYFSHGNYATTRGARGASSYQREICFDRSHRGGDHRCRSAGERRHIPTESPCGVFGRPRNRSRTDDSQRSVAPFSWRIGDNATLDLKFQDLRQVARHGRTVKDGITPAIGNSLSQP